MSGAADDEEWCFFDGIKSCHGLILDPADGARTADPACSEDGDCPQLSAGPDSFARAIAGGKPGPKQLSEPKARHGSRLCLSNGFSAIMNALTPSRLLVPALSPAAGRPRARWTYRADRQRYAFHRG